MIYAFNGNGKTQLSRTFKSLVSPKDDVEEDGDLTTKKIIYYNAFTEDLFYWDNDLEEDVSIKMKVHPNAFTEWVLIEQGQDQNVISLFQHLTNSTLTPKFSPDYREITFSVQQGNAEPSDNIKISKGEESSFVWSVFYSLLDQVIEVLNVAEPADRETEKFNNLNYVFIDDPVTSLDENHLIQLAVDLAQLIKKSDVQNGLKFVITTHNPIFYNVLYNEFNRSASCHMLDKQEDGTFDLMSKGGDSNKSFSYHLHLKKTLEKAIANNEIEKYHFTLLRNLYEKTGSFLGFPGWKELLPENKEGYYNRIMQYTSHSTLADETVAEPTPYEKQTVKLLLEHLIDNYSFWKEA